MEYKLNSEMYKPRREKHEFPKGAKELLICSECGAVYFKKSWKHNFKDYKNFKKDKRLDFVLCPACKMIKEKQFEGRIEITNIPQKKLAELKKMISSYCRRAYLRDPMDRLISIKEDVRRFIVTTTENQLAQKLAIKIKQTFNKANIKISHSKSPSDVVYIKIEFETR